MHILKSSIERLGRNIANRIVKPFFLKSITSVADIDLTEESILLDPKTIFLGGTTKATMNRLLNNGDITQATYDQFHKGVQVYYKDALDYIKRLKESFPSVIQLYAIVDGLMYCREIKQSRIK